MYWRILEIKVDSFIRSLMPLLLTKTWSKKTNYVKLEVKYFSRKEIFYRISEEHFLSPETLCRSNYLEICFCRHRRCRCCSGRRSSCATQTKRCWRPMVLDLAFASATKNKQLSTYFAFLTETKNEITMDLEHWFRFLESKFQFNLLIHVTLY